VNILVEVICSSLRKIASSKIKLKNRMKTLIKEKIKRHEENSEEK
jgi:hypothetical protein